jgi:hypothetical protein
LGLLGECKKSKKTTVTDNTPKNNSDYKKGPLKAEVNYENNFEEINDSMPSDQM